MLTCSGLPARQGEPVSDRVGLGCVYVEQILEHRAWWSSDPGRLAVSMMFHWAHSKPAHSSGCHHCQARQQDVCCSPSCHSATS